MLDEVEIATYNDVHVVGNVHEAVELFRAAAVVVLSRGQVYVNYARGHGCGAVTCAALKSDALGLTLEACVDGFGACIVMVAGAGRHHDGGSTFPVCWVVVEDGPERESAF